MLRISDENPAFILKKYYSTKTGDLSNYETDDSPAPHPSSGPLQYPFY